jgi:hypothetical protein
MPKCGVCGEKANKLYLCSSCGVEFCKKCGSIKEMTCSSCLDHKQENIEAEHEEEREKEHEEEEWEKEEEESEEEDEEDNDEPQLASSYLP